MMKKLPLRMQLTIMIMVLLTVSSVGLSSFLNFSAIKMTDTIEMTPIIYDVEGTVTEVFQAIELTPANEVNPFLIAVIEKAKTTFRLDSIIYTTIIILIGGLLTYYISGQTLKPIKSLNSQIQKIDINNLSQEVEFINTNDELAELARSFNNMIDKLTASFDMQKQFSANAAHELRTPLAVLQTKVDVFKKSKNHIESDYNSLITVFEKHTQRMSELVKDLLDLTNMQEIEINESIDLYSLIEEVLYDFNHIAKKNSISLNIDGEEAIIYGNYNLVHRALYNLIENGIKYNKKDGDVTVLIKQTRENVIINVNDTGVGIPSKFQPFIFDPFFRIEESRSRETAGSGLGLSIVKTIIDKHNGLISVKDNSSCGSSFQIILNRKCK